MKIAPLVLADPFSVFRLGVRSVFRDELDSRSRRSEASTSSRSSSRHLREQTSHSSTSTFRHGAPSRRSQSYAGPVRPPSSGRTELAYPQIPSSTLSESVRSES